MGFGWREGDCCSIWRLVVSRCQISARLPVISLPSPLPLSHNLSIALSGLSPYQTIGLSALAAYNRHSTASSPHQPTLTGLHTVMNTSLSALPSQLHTAGSTQTSIHYCTTVTVIHFLYLHFERRYYLNTRVTAQECVDCVALPKNIRLINIVRRVGKTMRSLERRARNYS